jgi:NodT family efflux transporter outer membrane factor (OMF) lipoprotein
MKNLLLSVRNSVFSTFLFLAILMLSGCAAVGPDYVRPGTEMPPTWHAAPDPAVVPGKTMIRCWWTVFGDPLLTQLIEEASQSNLDLKAAVARVDEARARLGVVSGERVPQVDAQGSAIRQRSSENALSNFGTRTFYSPGIAASWEIDLFGRIRRSVESAAADFQASEEDCTDVLITLYAEVARTYMDIRAYQARLDAAEGNIKSQKRVLELTRARFKYGLTTDLDVAQAQRVLASSEAEVPPLRIELARAVNTMAVLLGRPPGALYDELSW